MSEKRTSEDNKNRKRGRSRGRGSDTENFCEQGNDRSENDISDRITRSDRDARSDRSVRNSRRNNPSPRNNRSRRRRGSRAEEVLGALLRLILVLILLATLILGGIFGYHRWQNTQNPPLPLETPNQVVPETMEERVEMEL